MNEKHELRKQQDSTMQRDLELSRRICEASGIDIKGLRSAVIRIDHDSLVEITVTYLPSIKQ